MLALLLGLSALSLGIRALYFRKTNDVAKMQKYIGTKNSKAVLILGVTGIFIGLVFIFIGVLSTHP